MTPFKYILGLIVTLATVTPNLWARSENASQTNQDLAEYNSFVQGVGSQIVNLFANKQNPLSQRKQAFRQILKQHFSIESIGKFVLARYWRSATDTQKNNYLNLFEEALVENYSSHFDDYHNEKLEILNSRRTNDKGVLVQTRILRPQGGEPLIVDWKLFQVDGKTKVFDLIVNGASMSISLRTEYGSMVQANGGTVDGLLSALREKYSS